VVLLSLILGSICSSNCHLVIHELLLLLCLFSALTRNKVRPFKLTATSWAHDRKQGFVGSLPNSCKLTPSAGAHPVEYTGGKCFSAKTIDELRRPKGQIQLFARKFSPGVLQNLLDLNYLA